MGYKIGDKVICKKNDYGGATSYWYLRLFQSKKDYYYIFKKNEVYYVTNIDTYGIPNGMFLYSEKECISKSIPINQLLSVLWNASENRKGYFFKYFYGTIKEVRRNKLVKLSKLIS